ncbi:MAG TPA: hypothetical protein EYN13_07515 [Methylococcales bacterium]|nr:hypothetical protein [Methylococcales bacterium]
MQLKHGQYVVGVCKGIRENTRHYPDGNSKIEYFAGLSQPVTNGYEGQENIFEVKMSKAAVDSGDFRQFTKIVGKNVAVPINPMSRAYNGRSYTDNYFDNRRGVLVLDSQP